MERIVSERLKNGKFICTRCGICCKNKGIELSNSEIQEIANFLDISVSEFKSKYVRFKKVNYTRKIINHTYKIKGLATILSKKPDGNCVFLEFKGDKAVCKIYPARPISCKLFPFTWEYNPSTFKLYLDFSPDAIGICPGINNQAGESWDSMKNEITKVAKSAIKQYKEIIQSKKYKIKQLD